MVASGGERVPRRRRCEARKRSFARPVPSSLQTDVLPGQAGVRVRRRSAGAEARDNCNERTSPALFTLITIVVNFQAKRARSKNKYHKEAEKLQQKILESLVKENVVQQALGANAGLLFSPPKSKRARDDEDDDASDMFKLPALPAPEASNADESLEDSSMTDLSQEEDADSHYQHLYLQNLRQIDVRSSYFQSLPADIRYEILHDMKGMRKESSWGRLHELPAESQSFSKYQMSRLLKRRQVQVELEEAERQIGGKTLTLAELECLLSENGIVDADLAKNRIVSNEHVRYLHVCDVKKAMEREAKNEKRKTSEVREVVEVEPTTEEDYALQKAIQLSLGCLKEEDAEMVEEGDSGEIRMTEKQRRVLASTATSLARNYMIEYGDMNDSQIAAILKPDEVREVQPQKEFKYNDESVIQPKEATPDRVTAVERPRSPALSISSSKDAEGIEISSDADSDFVDVPDISIDEDMPKFLAEAKRPLPKPFLMNEPPTPNPDNDFRQNNCDSKDIKLEVVIDPEKNVTEGDDIFSDIFGKPKAEIKEEGVQESPPKESSVEKIPFKGSPVMETETFSEVVEITEEDAIPVKKPSNEKVEFSKILDDLEKEMEKVKEADFDTILAIDIAKAPEEFQAAEIVEKPEVDEVNETPIEIQKTPPSSERTVTVIGEKTASTVELADVESIESLPSTSNATQEAAAARSLLRTNKTEDELNEMAAQLNVDRYELLSERNKRERLGVSITEQMTLDCMELMKLFGMPYIVAPMEAEAQCAFLNQNNLTDGTITDDSDIWLFGGQTVYKNFFDQSKLVMEFKLDNIKKLYHIDRNAMIQLSILVGSDYTSGGSSNGFELGIKNYIFHLFSGISGVGTVTAMEILSLFSRTEEMDTSEIRSVLSGLRKFRDWWQGKAFTSRTAALRKKLRNIALSEDFPSSRVRENSLWKSRESY